MRRAESITRTIDRLEEELVALREREAVFGSNEDYPNEAVIFFQRNFYGESWRSGVNYTYAAVKASGSWYVTGRARDGFRISFDTLVDDFLAPAMQETGEVWYVTEMKRIELT